MKREKKHANELDEKRERKVIVPVSKRMLNLDVFYLSFYRNDLIDISNSKHHHHTPTSHRLFHDFSRRFLHNEMI